MKWIRITHVDEIPAREGRTVNLHGREIAVFHTTAGFLAIDNRCPHGGGPLADGIVGGTTVACPLHNWRVCLESGGVVQGCGKAGASVETYPIRIEDGMILLSLDSIERAA